MRKISLLLHCYFYFDISIFFFSKARRKLTNCELCMHLRPFIIFNKNIKIGRSIHAGYMPVEENLLHYYVVRAFLTIRLTTSPSPCVGKRISRYAFNVRTMYKGSDLCFRSLVFLVNTFLTIALRKISSKLHAKQTKHEGIEIWYHVWIWIYSYLCVRVGKKKGKCDKYVKRNYNRLIFFL